MTSHNQPKPKANIYRSPRWKQDHSRHKPKEDGPKLACKIASTCQTCKYINQSYDLSLDERYTQGIELLKSHNLLDGTQMAKPVASPKHLNTDVMQSLL